MLIKDAASLQSDAITGFVQVASAVVEVGEVDVNDVVWVAEVDCPETKLAVIAVTSTRSPCIEPVIIVRRPRVLSYIV